jgi:membrane protein DedA with SNARE-associated domain
MEQALDFVARHGAVAIFVLVFLRQLGFPIPTIPLLLAFGALAGSGRIDPVSSLVVAICASVCADVVWYQLGRKKGARVLSVLCRIALEPDTCVSKTHDLFARYGVKSLLVAKFVPGFDTVAPPLAGMLGIGVMPFALWSSAGALLWLGTYGGLGYLFSDRLDDFTSAADQLGSTLGVVVIGLVVAYLAWKYLARRLPVVPR